MKDWDEPDLLRQLVGKMGWVGAQLIGDVDNGIYFVGPGQLVVFSKLVGFDLGGADLGLHDQATLSLPGVEDKQSIGPAVHTFGLTPEDRFCVAVNLRPAADLPA